MSADQDKAFGALSNRSVWDQKQRLWYQMRHDGMRRLNKPFPTAADSHFPLIDMNIGNLKPFWVGQVFGGERMADFVCLREQLGSMSEASADFMDYELRFRTNFRLHMERAVDHMLLRGRGVLKIVYDPFTKRIVFRSISPEYIIMAEQYDDFEDADWFVEIQTLTVEQYKRDRNLSQDALPTIRGKSEWQMQQTRFEKQIREGITHSTREDIIVLWNYYERTASGYLQHTKCPMAWDTFIREPYKIPYKWDGETLLPFYSLTMEIKDEGWYAPRGIAELNAAFEAYCTKLWNDKSDAMTFANKPLYTSENEIVNSGNIRFLPGEFIPGNIKAVQQPAPAFSFSEEINFTRGVAEQRSKMPDYGVTSEGDSNTGGKPRTATENNRIASLQDVSSDHNAEMFRTTRLTKIYRHVWALICHREEVAKASGQPGTLTYYAADSLKTLPEQALHDQYLVIPAGASGTKMQKIQRATARYQLFVGKPNIDQDELAKQQVAADDPRLVNKLVIPSGQKAESEAFQEDVEIIVMAEGRPVPVLMGQDHLTRIKELVGYMEKQHVTGAPVNPMAQQVMLQHLGQHFQMLKQADPQGAKQVEQTITQMEQQANPPPANVQPMPQGAMAQ